MTPYFITTKPDSEGRQWGVCHSDTDFSVQLFFKGADTIKFTLFGSIMDALRSFHGAARYDRMEIDWTSYMVDCGERIIVQSEYKGLAREDIMVFATQDDYDAWRREKLQDYEDDSDLGQVEALIASGDLDGAWHQANDDCGEKELWNTAFGSHSTETDELKVPFTSLPAWIQNTIKDAITA